MDSLCKKHTEEQNNETGAADSSVVRVLGFTKVTPRRPRVRIPVSGIFAQNPTRRIQEVEGDGRREKPIFSSYQLTVDLPIISHVHRMPAFLHNYPLNYVSTQHLLTYQSLLP